MAEPSGRHLGFRVRGRRFADLLDDHRGDEGLLGLVVKAGPGEAEALVAARPERFQRPADLGHRGWVACGSRPGRWTGPRPGSWASRAPC